MEFLEAKRGLVLSEVVTRSSHRVLSLTLCTARRSVMLTACLESILPQRVPDGWRFCLVVIDNDSTPSANQAVGCFAKRAPFLVHYEHEPRRGIPMARNRALDVALSLGADWIACVDDDERLAPDWLPRMIAAIEEESGDVIQGPVVYEWPGGFWSQNRQKVRGPDGTRLKSAATGNVAFASWLAATSRGGEAIRFDESLQFTGGEDVDFFRRATREGARIVWASGPQVMETVPAERATYVWQVKRSYRNGAIASRLAFKQSSTALALVFVKSVGRLLSGITSLVLAPFAALFSRTAFKRLALDGGKHLGWAIGAFAGMRGRMPEPYRNIDGQ